MCEMFCNEQLVSKVKFLDYKMFQFFFQNSRAGINLCPWPHFDIRIKIPLQSYS